MIKVAFAIDAGWMGGINYYRNLLHAIALIKNRKIEPVVIVGMNTNPELLKDLPHFQVIRTSILDRFSFRWWINKMMGGNYLFNRLLKKNSIKVNSHTLHGGSTDIKTIGWIPDFQHRHLSHLFSSKEIEARNRQFTKIAMTCTRMILSSEDARKDFESFAPSQAGKARVLSFVSIPSFEKVSNLASLQKKYGIDRPYFYVPNQFWAHKNHKVIVDAVIALKTNYPDILVVSTGATQDYRNPEYFPELNKRIDETGIMQNFKVLGIVPFQDVVGLMLNAQAMINPSLFEGWSTTVEEAKSLGVPLLLSEIPVHIEQAKDTAIFFAAGDSTSLAEKIIGILERKKMQQVTPMTAERTAINQNRLTEFGTAYQRIVLEMMCSLPCRNKQKGFVPNE